MNVDAPRISNTEPNNSKGIISFFMGYLERIDLLKKYFKISGRIFDFGTISTERRNQWLGEFSVMRNHRLAPYNRRFDDLYSLYFRPFTILLKDSNFLIKKFNDRIQKLFVPKVYHDRRQTNFLKDMGFVGKYPNTNEYNFCRFKAIGRQLYEYRVTNQSIQEFTPQQIEIFSK